MINTRTNDFMAKLTELVRTSGLPVCNARLCLDAVRAQLLQLEAKAIEEEKKEEGQ